MKTNDFKGKLAWIQKAHKWATKNLKEHNSNDSPKQTKEKTKNNYAIYSLLMEDLDFVFKDYDRLVETGYCNGCGRFGKTIKIVGNPPFYGNNVPITKKAKCKKYCPKCAALSFHALECMD